MATVLGLLLFVSFLASYVFQAIPGQMQTNEFVHGLLVENQLAQLQSTVLAEAKHQNSRVAVLTPVTLGTSPDPPFVPSSTSALSPESTSASVGVGYSLNRVVAAPPNWNATLGCPTTGSPCHGVVWDNITGTPNSSYSLKINGGNPAAFVNFTGSNDSLSLLWVGKSISQVYIVINGSYDHLTLVKGSNGGSSYTPNIQIYVYGQHDVVETGLNGDGITMDTHFIGTGSVYCPYQNNSNSDHFYWNSTGNANTTVVTTWYNNVGYNSNHPIGLQSGSTLTFQNVSLFRTGCAWTVTYHSSFGTGSFTGLRVHLNNVYSTPADVVYDLGAVILNHPGAGSIMLDPPKMSIGESSGQLVANLTLVDEMGQFSTTAGSQTAGVLTKLVSVQHSVLGLSNPGQLNLGAVYINLTTPYPFAWYSVLARLAGLAPGSGVACVPPYAFSGGYSCLTPPPGVSVQLSVGLNVYELILTVITVQFTLS